MKHKNLFLLFCLLICCVMTYSDDIYDAVKKCQKEIDVLYERQLTESNIVLGIIMVGFILVMIFICVFSAHGKEIEFLRAERARLITELAHQEDMLKRSEEYIKVCLLKLEGGSQQTVIVDRSLPHSNSKRRGTWIEEQRRNSE